MRTLAALALAVMSLTACASTTSSVCPSLVEYTAARQDKVADELAAMPADAETPIFMADYKRLRDQVRACRK